MLAARMSPLCGRWPIGVPQHGVKGPGEVVGLSAAVVLFGRGQQAGQEQQQQEQQLEGERCPDHAGEEGALRPGATWVSGSGRPVNRRLRADQKFPEAKPTCVT